MLCFPEKFLGVIKMNFQQRMNRSLTRIRCTATQRNDDFVPGSLASRISMVWPLTREVASLNRYHDVEQRLQRDVAVLSRRKR